MITIITENYSSRHFLATFATRSLRNLDLFEQVRLDKELRNLIWPNDADFDPWMLHEWDKLADKLAAQAMSWERVPTGV